MSNTEGSTDTAAPAERKGGKRQSPLRGYLILYNFISCMAWCVVTYHAIVNVRNYKDLYAIYGRETAWTQTLAVMEIVHSLLGIVRSPLTTTFVQVNSRLLLVWGICYMYPFNSVIGDWPYTSMVIAWGITEIVRYAYYALNQLGYYGDYYWFVVWCRYNLFYVLYPIGAGSELILIQRALPYASKLHPEYTLALRIISFTYPFGFYMLYTHMMKQRRKFIESGVLEAKDAFEEEKTAAEEEANAAKEAKKDN